ncbi:MAG TPA: response regulator transcription factor [Flavobacteriia bacterium]|nr:response regulator transcription factor [Flavobacteriia bacterium]
MKKIKAILIDDEEKALEGLQLKINRFFKEIEIIALCDNPEDAIKSINKLQPDLVFLDIEMPVYSGFDVLSKVTYPDFETIFVTAYNNFAIDAIKHCAIGYILKPIDNDELKLAVTNAIKNISKKTALENNINLLNKLGVNTSKTSIAIPTNKGLNFIKIENIIRFEGIDGYTKIICTDKNDILSSYSIGKFINMLESNQFFSPHKSHFVNLNHIDSILKEGNILLKDGVTIPLSKSKRADLIAKMEHL